MPCSTISFAKYLSRVRRELSFPFNLRAGGKDLSQVFIIITQLLFVNTVIKHDKPNNYANLQSVGSWVSGACFSFSQRVWGWDAWLELVSVPGGAALALEASQFRDYWKKRCLLRKEVSNKDSAIFQNERDCCLKQEEGLKETHERNGFHMLQEGPSLLLECAVGLPGIVHTSFATCKVLE